MREDQIPFRTKKGETYSSGTEDTRVVDEDRAYYTPSLPERQRISMSLWLHGLLAFLLDLHI